MAVKGKKNLKIEQAEATQVIEKVATLKAPVVVTEIAEVQVSIQQTLAGLSSQITEKLAMVETLDKGIALKEQRLNELHGIEAAAVTIDDMKAQQESLRATFEQEMQTTRTQWDEEVDTREKQWDREEQEHAYQTQLARKKNQDEWDAMLAKRQRDEANRQADLAKGWQDREAKLAAQEAEITAMRAQVANFPNELKKAEEKAAAIAGNTVKREYEQKLQIAEINAANDRKMAENTVASLSSQIATLKAQLETAQSEIKAANTRAENIAAKAVEASSGRQALEAVQRQAETLGQPNGKGR